MANLKKLRLDKELTQKEVADKLGLAESTISLYESGKRHPNIEVLKKYAAIFGCTLDELAC